MSGESVIIHFSNLKGIASYVMALVVYFETFSDEEGFEEVKASIQQLKEVLEPMLPEERREE